MKIKIFKIIILLSSITTSCINYIPMVDQSIRSTTNGKPIIYGKFDDLIGGTASNLTLYNAEKDKFYTLIIKGRVWGKIYEKFFAYEIPEGEYDIYSYDIRDMINTKTTYYLFSKEGYIELLKLNRKPKKSDYKKISHDKLFVRKNEIIYIGEWSFKDNFPKIRDRKIENDSEINNTFYRFDTRKSIKLIPQITISKKGID